jgi:hypothetical protein
MAVLSQLFASQTPANSALPISDGSGDPSASLDAWVSNGTGGSGGDIQTMLDALSTTVGAIIARGPSGWQAVEPDVPGFVLTTHGSGALPTWEFPGSTPVSSLFTSLVEWWELDEASGTRAGDFAGLDLTDNNGVGATTGPDGSPASLFVRSSSQFLSRADQTALRTGDIDFTFCGWVYLQTKSSARGGMILAKDDVSTTREYTFGYELFADRFSIEVFTGTTRVGQALANTLGAPSTGQWYFVVGWHDVTNNLVGIQVDNGTADTFATTGAPTTGTAQFRVGSDAYAVTPALLDGRSQRVGFWKRLLTAGEKTTLYNAGNGISYPFPP